MSLLFKEILEEISRMGDTAQAKKMSDYMKGKFVFLGIPKPDLMRIIKPHLSESRKEPIDWDGIFTMWNSDYREAQYVALEYMNVHRKQIKPDDLEKICTLITTKSWWETVDTLDSFVGDILLKEPAVRDELLKWSVSDNIWLRRAAIDCQQKFKDRTDRELLASVIKNNLGSNEFFINKAIGWSLREYSKVNPDWVRSFIEDNKQNLDKLSIREATKYL